MDSRTFIMLYKALVRPHVEYVKFITRHRSSFSTPNGMAIFQRNSPAANGVKKSRLSTNISLYLGNDTR